MIADALPADNLGVTEKRTAPRAQLALTEWMVGGSADSEQFVAQLRLLTAEPVTCCRWPWRCRAGSHR